MLAYQEEKSIKSKTKDVDIPISKILTQSPIKHNVLSKINLLEKEKLLMLQKKRSHSKKDNLIIGSANILITEVTIIIYFFYPV